jgi:hypothetical protein
MTEIARCAGCSLPIAAGRHAEDCPITPGEPPKQIEFQKSAVVEFLGPFGGLGKIVAGVMQMFGIPKIEREEVRAKVDAAVASGDACWIAFEMGEYRYRVRIG